jgi:hypothetical protein
MPGAYTLTVTVSATGQPAQQGTAHFTLVAADLAAVKVYPNPWRKDKHIAQPDVTFANLPSNATVKIFTVSGHLVKDLGKVNGHVSWNLKNESGDKVASGVYIYLVTNDQNQKLRGKLAIIR